MTQHTWCERQKSTKSGLLHKSKNKCKLLKRVYLVKRPAEIMHKYVFK